MKLHRRRLSKKNEAYFSPIDIAQKTSNKRATSIVNNFKNYLTPKNPTWDSFRKKMDRNASLSPSIPNLFSTSNSHLNTPAMSAVITSSPTIVHTPDDVSTTSTTDFNIDEVAFDFGPETGE